MTAPGYQTKFAYGNTADYDTATVWTDFADITEFTPPDLSSDDTETSNMETAKQIKTFVPAWADPGEVQLSLQFSKEQAVTLYSLFRVPKAFRIMFNDLPSPSGSVHLMNGYIKGISNETDREGIISCKVVVKVSGESDFVPAGS